VDVFTSIDSALTVPSVNLTELKSNPTLLAQFETTFKGDIGTAAGVSADSVTINAYSEVGASPARRSRVLLQQGGDGVVVDYSVDFPPVRVLQTEADAAEPPTEALAFAAALADNPSTLLNTLATTYGELVVTVQPVLQRQVVVLFSPPPPLQLATTASPPPPLGGAVTSMPSNVICSRVKDASTCTSTSPQDGNKCVWAADKSCCRADSAVGGFCSNTAGTGMFNARATIQFAGQSVTTMTEARRLQFQTVISDTLGLGNTERVVILSADVVAASQRRSLLQTATVAITFELVGFDSQAEVADALSALELACDSGTVEAVAARYGLAISGVSLQPGSSVVANRVSAADFGDDSSSPQQSAIAAAVIGLLLLLALAA
jgi:hypothetical protein